MEKEILISDDEYETRCAVLEERVLNEIYIERKAAAQTLGNLYKGRVENVLPGMQVAFVDIGLERHAFLHISDLKYEHADEDDDENEKQNGDRKSNKNTTILDLKGKRSKHPRGGRGFPFLISDLISKKQELLVQVGKEPIGTKGARVTSNITLPGRYVVYMPNSSNIGVSRRIESATERDRLRNMAKAVKATLKADLSFVLPLKAWTKPSLPPKSDTLLINGSRYAPAQRENPHPVSSVKTSVLPTGSSGICSRRRSNNCLSIQTRGTRRRWSTSPPSCPI